LSKLLRYEDNQKQCWSRVDLSNGDPIWISIARTGIVVKRSRLGLMGTILLKESNTRILYRIYEAISKQVLEYKTPSNMTQPFLKVLTQAALDADSASQLKILLNNLSSEA
jgi:hypothetical protein